MSTISMNPTDVIGSPDHDVLVLGHSLGTSAALWHDAALLLQRRFRVLCWELPGHGDSAPADAPFRIEDLTDALVGRLDALGVDRFHYAGVSIGGCVGLDLGLRHGDRVLATSVISAGARVDSPEFWQRRADSVRTEGTESLVEPSRGRWFAPSTSAETVETLLGILRTTDATSYALAAEALAAFDVWDDLPQMAPRLLAVAGQVDEAVPVDRSRRVALAVPRGALAVIPDAAHSVAAEQPERVAAELIAFHAAS